MGPDTGSGRPSPRGGGPACSRRNPHTPHGTCPGSAPEYPWEPVEFIPDPYAVQRARELIADVESVRGDTMMAEWIGRATSVLRELTRDA